MASDSNEKMSPRRVGIFKKELLKAQLQTIPIRKRVQSKKQRKEMGVQLLSVDVRMITDDKEKGKVLNSYFCLGFSQKKI
ncbi:Aspartyl/glutamyl-tRNA(Asn/Gln) amidotransferase subunit B [Varanus komodoensis]|nr:Aspartyl/glutamyl-tRNA(Asn/Gln) amidotransferase subunit B [Varanus komodoensis]